MKTSRREGGRGAALRSSRAISRANTIITLVTMGFKACDNIGSEK